MAAHELPVHHSFSMGGASSTPAGAVEPGQFGAGHASLIGRAYRFDQTLPPYVGGPAAR